MRKDDETRLIDADKLQLRLLDMEFPICGQDKILDAMDACMVDAKPVVHGHWILVNEAYGLYKCSICSGTDRDCNDCYSLHDVTSQDFCPCCGAKMDEEERK